MGQSSSAPSMSLLCHWGTLTGPIPLRTLDPFRHNYPATDVPSSDSWLDGGVTESSKEKWANPQSPIHRAIARWAAMCAERALSVFEERRRDDGRPRAAGQAAAVAHMFDHAPHAASYAAKAIGLHGTGEADRKTERTWQWENLDPELRAIGFPKGL